MAIELIETAEATRNPFALSWALVAYGYAFHESDPIRSRDALRRGLAIAEESGNRMSESILLMTLGRAEADTGNPIAAVDYARRSILSYRDTGNTSAM